MRHLYSLLAYLLAPTTLLHLFVCGIREPGYWRRIPERFAYRMPLVPEDRKRICIHAVSVGEALAAKFPVELLERNFPGHCIVMSAMTPSGSETIRRAYGQRVVQTYLPYDLPGMARRFLAHFKPEALLIMETEIWPNLIAQCHAQGIPVLLLNARLSEKSASGYRRFVPFIRSTLASIDLIVAQCPADADRFQALGAREGRVHAAGSLKYLMPVHGDGDAMMRARRDFAGRRLIWVAGSTHPGEEGIVLRVHQWLRRRFPDLLLIFAPRHIPRRRKALSLCRRSGLNAVCRSETGQCPADAAIFLLDMMGELPRHYAYADVAFVGGSLSASGGHNVLEPISSGVMAVTGMGMRNFLSVAEDMRSVGALMQVRDEEGLRTALEQCLANLRESRARAARGRDFIKAQAERVREIEPVICEVLGQC